MLLDFHTEQRRAASENVIASTQTRRSPTLRHFASVGATASRIDVRLEGLPVTRATITRGPNGRRSGRRRRRSGKSTRGTETGHDTDQMPYFELVDCHQRALLDLKDATLALEHFEERIIYASIQVKVGFSVPRLLPT